MNEYMLAFFAKNIVMSRCPSLYQSNMLAYTHTHTATELTQFTTVTFNKPVQ